MPQLPQNLSFTIQIKMTSDWHVGSGNGYGEVDSAVQRDHDNLPYIPAKTLTGILRDGCEQAAIALDGGKKTGQWHNWINFIFGDQPALAEGAIEPAPRPAVVSIGSAYLDNDLRDALKAKKGLKEAIAFIKPGVAIDPKTGSAEPQCLRFEEVVRMGAVLNADIGLDFSPYEPVDQTTKEIVYALILAGTKLVERLGGKRRRGNGNCEITTDASRDKWLRWFKDNYSDIEEPPSFNKEESADEDNSLLVQNPQPITVNNTETWWRIPLRIKTLSPVVIPKRTVGNVVESLDYIPGRYFIGHLHRKIGQSLDLNGAIATNQIIITNATVEIAGRAGKPTPFCLFGKKLGGGLSKGKSVYNRFVEAEPKGIQLKGERGGYVGAFDDEQLPDHHSIKLGVNTHNTVQDEVQRPTSDVGGVYSYQAIPINTIFRAEIRIPQSLKTELDQTQDWQNKLDGILRIGQSKKDQYGKIKISVERPEALPTQKSLKGNLLSLWFLSDVLLRDERLQPTTDPEVLRQVLEKELQVTLTKRDDDELMSLMMRSQRNESWQVRWGLPRPTMLGWQAGSCLVYQVEGDINPQKLAELEAKGIGDRRVEGYGQISFNDPLLTAELSKLEREDSKSQPDSSPPQPIASNSKSFEYARLIETAAWRKKIQDMALAIAADPEKREEILGLRITDDQSHPSMSQLGGLRSVIRNLQSPQDISKVTSWFDALKKTANRREKWDKTDDGLDKIRTLVTNDQIIWRHFSDINWQSIKITEDGKSSLKTELWAEAVRTLVDAIVRGHKRDLEKAQDNIREEAA
ncbi:RAMP superfamily CRISPR-associated protein [[Limnothrix rosea] IAM M-220]|uniref:RAMP superfamily CRISPR-associated protein n=1 Tax=[Limnothrix rosea] IAM M-220 TaxID=454133 RepID=UPI001C0D3B1A|nr:RAMP superfamily CRISPR-associated protein [[Limnothrix rosea] IAM M-220]